MHCKYSTCYKNVWQLKILKTFRIKMITCILICWCCKFCIFQSPFNITITGYFFSTISNSILMYLYINTMEQLLVQGSLEMCIICSFHPLQSKYFRLDCDKQILSNTQVPRYLLFCEGGIYSTHAHTSVGTKLTSYIGKTS